MVAVILSKPQVDDIVRAHEYGDVAVPLQDVKALATSHEILRSYCRSVTELIEKHAKEMKEDLVKDLLNIIPIKEDNGSESRASV